MDAGDAVPAWHARVRAPQGHKVKQSFPVSIDRLAEPSLPPAPEHPPRARREAWSVRPASCPSPSCQSRVTGLVREIVMARLFGAGFIYDAFLLGFRIPNLTRDLFAEGALSSAFVPSLHHYLATRRKTKRRCWRGWWRPPSSSSAAFCALGMVFAPALVGLLAPGFAHGARQVRAGRHHDAHHVPLPAAGGAGGAGHGRC